MLAHAFVATMILGVSIAALWAWFARPASHRHDGYQTENDGRGASSEETFEDRFAVGFAVVMVLGMLAATIWGLVTTSIT